MNTHLRYKKITVLGAGNGGYATAFDLSQRGYEVMLYELPSFHEALSPIQASGEIQSLKSVNLFGKGFTSVLSGQAKIHHTTTDIALAADFADIFILVAPSFAHTAFFKELMPHLNDGDIVLSMPGSYAAMTFSQMLKDANITKEITFVDSDTLPYACRKIKDNTIFISGLKRAIHVATHPKEKSETLLPILNNLFTTKLRSMQNVIAVELSNLNLVVHPVTSLLNAARIEDKDTHFYFYSEGVSKGIGRLAEKLDLERLEFGKHLNLDLLPFLKLYHIWYGDRGNSIYEAVHDPFHRFFLAPETLNNRYFTEDIPYLMVPILAYAKKHKINLPIMTSIFTLSAGLLGEEVLKPSDTIPDFGEFLND